MEPQTSKPIQFDLSNLRQTAKHVIKYRGCKASFDEEQLIEYMKKEATAVANTEETGTEKLFSVDRVTAWFTLEDTIIDSKPTIAPNFFVRVGRRQEQAD